MACVFRLLQRKKFGARAASGDLQTPIRFSDYAQHQFISCRTPILVLFTGASGIGKSLRIDQLVTADLRSEEPFLCGGDSPGISDIWANHTRAFLQHVEDSDDGRRRVQFVFRGVC
jgi:hypothetical protein